MDMPRVGLRHTEVSVTFNVFGSSFKREPKIDFLLASSVE